MASTPISGPELRARRLALGLSQAGLADALGVTQVTISRWEAGTRTVGASVDDELAALEDALTGAVAQRLASGVDTFVSPDGSDLPPTDAVAAARAADARRRASGSIGTMGAGPVWPVSIDPSALVKLDEVARLDGPSGASAFSAVTRLARSSRLIPGDPGYLGSWDETADRILTGKQVTLLDGACAYLALSRAQHLYAELWVVYSTARPTSPDAVLGSVHRADSGWYCSTRSRGWAYTDDGPFDTLEDAVQALVPVYATFFRDLEAGDDPDGHEHVSILSRLAAPFEEIGEATGPRLRDLEAAGTEDQRRRLRTQELAEWGWTVLDWVTTDPDDKPIARVRRSPQAPRPTCDDHPHPAA